MTRKPTLVLAILLLASLGFLLLFEAKAPNTRELKVISSSVLGRFERAEVGGLEIHNGDTRIDLRRDSARPATANAGEPVSTTRWSMRLPVIDRVDPITVDNLLSELESYRRESTTSVPGSIADPAKLAPFGLQNPRLRLKILPVSDGKNSPPETEILFGGNTPVQGRIFVQVAGREEVYAALDPLRKELEKDPGEFRDHAFTDLTVPEIGRLNIKNTGGVALELARESGQWKLLKPQAARANDQKLNEIVNRLADLRISRFVSADDKSPVGALNESRGTVTIATLEPSPRVVDLQVGRATENLPPQTPPGPGDGQPPPGGVYAASPGRPGLFVVPRTVEELFALKPEDLRDRQLARLNPDSVDRVRVQPGGGETFIFSRVKGKSREWTLRVPGTNDQEHPAHGVEVERLLTRLPTQNVSRFVADSAGDLPKYGLDQPTLRVSYFSVASEATAESGAGEKPIATISFGKADGVNVYVRLEEEPFIVTVPRGTLEAVPIDPLAWQSPEVFSINPELVRALGVSIQGQPGMRVERTVENPTGWRLAGGGGVAVDNVQANSVANTLARLRAVRWVGASKPDQGFDQPEATLEFSTNDPKIGGKILVGARAPEGGWFARVEGRAGSFLMNEPDHETLLRPLHPVSSSVPTSQVNSTVPSKTQ